jgi:hypothetical protein
VVTLACALGGAAFGMFWGARFPAHRREADSRDSVKMAIGVVSTLTALVLGFLVASAKNSFDAKSGGVARIATDTILLDQATGSSDPFTRTEAEIGRPGGGIRREEHRAGPERATEFSRLVDRQVVGDAAVDQQPPADLDRRKGARNGHARPHRLRQAAAVEHDGFAGLDVGCDRVKRNRELPEILECGRTIGEAAEEALDRNSGDDAPGQSE